MPRFSQEQPSVTSSTEKVEVMDLSEQRRTLFQHLREKQAELPQTQQVALCGLIFQHSLEDGLEAAEIFGLSGEALGPVFSQERFLLCHPKFAASLSASFKDALPSLTAIPTGKLRDADDRIKNLEKKGEETARAKSLNHRDVWEITFPKSGAGRFLYERTEDYYARTLSARASGQDGILKANEFPDGLQDAGDLKSIVRTRKEQGRKTGLQIGEAHVRRYADALSGDYLSGEIYRLAIPLAVDYIVDRGPQFSGAFYNEFRDRLSPAPNNEDDFWKQVKTGQPQIHELITSNLLPWHRQVTELDFFSPIIKKQRAEDLLSLIGHTQTVSIDTKKLEAARYKILSPIAKAGERSAVKNLQQEIKDGLKMHGHDPDKVEFVRTADGGYEAVQNNPDKKDNRDAPKTEFNWDLSTFETTEFNAGTKNIGIEKIYRIDGETVIKCKRDNLEILLYITSNIETQPYSFIEPIGKTRDGNIALARKLRSNNYIFLIDGKEFIPPDCKIIYDSAVVYDGKLAYVGTRPDGTLVLNTDGSEKELPYKCKYVNTLRYANGTFYFKAHTEQPPEDILLNSNFKQLDKSSSIDKMDIFEKGIAYVKHDSQKWQAVYDGKIIAESSTEIDMLPSNSAIPEPVFCLSTNSSECFLYSDNTKSPEFKSININGVVSNDDDYLIPCIDQNGNNIIYSLRQRQEILNLQQITPIDPQIIDGEIAFICADSQFPNAKKKLFLKGPNKMRQVNIQKYDLKCHIGKDEVAIAEVNGDNIRILHKERTTQPEPASGDVIYTKDSVLKRKMQLLNIIGRLQNDAIPDQQKLDDINIYFAQQHPIMSWKDELRSVLSGSSKIVDTLNQAIRDNPRLFLDTIPAVRDRTDKAFMERVLCLLFPEISAALEADRRVKAKQTAESITLKDRLRKLFGGHSHKDTPHYLAPSAESRLEGGDPMEKGGAEIMRFRERPPGMIATEFYGGYNPRTNAWQPLDLPVLTHLQEPVKEYTAEIPITPGMREVRLPLAVCGRIIPERIKGRRKGKETKLESQKNVNGLTTVPVTGSPEIILYSQQVSNVPVVPADVSQKTYDEWKKRLQKNGGEALLEQVGLLSPEDKLFLDKIKNLPPKEKLLAIEEYVKTIGYYDFHNAEMQDAKRNANPTDNIALMRDRMKSLCQKRPDLNKKQYAGVCSDFAILTASLLREAGFVSGIVMGFNPAGKSITKADAHTASFVLWPNANGDKYELIVVDTTPSGTTPQEIAVLANIKLPSLAETEAKKEDAISDALANAREKLKDIEKLDANTITKLTNGDLERAINTILRYDVKQSHVEVLREILNVAAYSPAALTKIDLNNPEDRVKFLSWMRMAMESKLRELAKLQDRTDRPAGTELVHLITEFEHRFTGDVPREQVFGVLKNIMDIARDYLDPKEHRAATAVITYLEAKQMKKGR